MSCAALDQNEIVGLCLNKIIYKDETKNIVSFEDVVKDKDIFINKILAFMDVLYQDVELFDDKTEEILIFHMI